MHDVKSKNEVIHARQTLAKYCVTSEAAFALDPDERFAIRKLVDLSYALVPETECIPDPNEDADLEKLTALLSSKNVFV